ncbi:hypothetical protein BGX27_002698 [Mortierella sp. AM989]|nr:hypothetical protein BGX27_002698 [Mortierella sp. AM989]
MLSPLIRIRVAGPLSPSSTFRGNSMDLADSLPSKFYTLTNFMNYEQALMEIEKSWVAYRQCERDGVVKSKNFEIKTRDATLPIAVDHSILNRTRHGSLRERRRLVRAQSLVEGTSYSGSSIVGRLETSVSNSRSPSNSTNVDIIDEDETLLSPRWPKSLFNQSKPTSNLELSGINQLQSSRISKNNTRILGEHHVGSSSDDSFERPESGPSPTLNFSTGDDDVSFIQALAAPIPIQISSSSSPSLRGYRLKSPTPPPSLLSPSLTTTKVSRSSSTVHGTAGQSASSGMIVHVRTESEGSKFDENSRNKIETPGQLTLQSRSTSGSGEQLLRLSRASTPSESHTSLLAARSEIALDPSSPVLCGCERHYKNAILSTVVPISLEMCFDLLFSGQRAGRGDALTSEAHRSADGSTDVVVAAWTTDNLQDFAAISSEWEKRKRQLEYSVLFKVPMLSKTSTMCIETQEILQHSSNIIRIHSESKLPNVPYGEQFSSVNQICMTWESPGNTRIKCFTEVRFRKSIMLSGKVEAASLEVSGGFYRELIRQLVEASEAQSTSLIAHSVLPALGPLEAFVRSPNMSSDSVADFKEDGFNGDNSSIATLSAPSKYRRPSGVSAAQSLLSQQYLKNPPTIARRQKLSTSSSPPVEFTLPERASRGIADLVLKGRKNRATTSMKSTDPATSLVDTAPTTHPDTADGGGVITKDKTANLKTTAADLWSTLLKGSLALFNKTSTDVPGSSLANGAISDGHDDLAATSDDTVLNSSTTEPESTAPGESNGIQNDKASVSNTSGIEQMIQDVSVPPWLKKSHIQPRTISRVVIWTFALGLMVSILNAWRLINMVSSVAEIMQTRNDQVDSTVGQYNNFGASIISQHLQKQAYLVPLQIQTEMLRAEILELMDLLETQKMLNQLHQQSRS